MSSEVWICLLVATIIVIATMAFLNKMDKGLDNYSSLAQILSSLLGQGSGEIPRYSINFELIIPFNFMKHCRCFSSKILTFSWWTFLIFLMNSYAANLAAAFTNHLLESNINSVGGLLEAPDIRFGSLNGATFSVLQVCDFMLIIAYRNNRHLSSRPQRAQLLEKLLQKFMTMDIEPPHPRKH